MPKSKGIRRRQQILQTAHQLFASQPYADVTMADIASACGVARTTLYDYFKTKEDILIELLDEVVTAARTTEAVGNTTYEKLCSLASDSLRRMKENRVVYRIVFGESGTFSKEAMDRIHDMTNRWGAHVRQVLAEGAYDITSSIPCDDVLFAYQALVGDWGRWMTMGNDDFDVEAKARELVSILWFGVGRQGGIHDTGTQLDEEILER